MSKVTDIIARLNKALTGLVGDKENLTNEVRESYKTEEGKAAILLTGTEHYKTGGSQSTKYKVLREYVRRVTRELKAEVTIELADKTKVGQASGVMVFKPIKASGTKTSSKGKKADADKPDALPPELALFAHLMAQGGTTGKLLADSVLKLARKAETLDMHTDIKRMIEGFHTQTDDLLAVVIGGTVEAPKATAKASKK